MSTESDALAAIDRVIDDFGHNRRNAYFAGFAEDATFLFYSAPGRLESRAEYEAMWDGWVRDGGFEVLSCASSGRRIQLFGDVAVFTHDVETTLRMDGAIETQRERETIVMQHRGDGWLCIHEHLSARDDGSVG